MAQDHDDIFLTVPVASDVAPGEVSVDFGARSLRVAVCGKEIVSGELPQPVHPDDSTWQFGARRGCTRSGSADSKACPDGAANRVTDYAPATALVVLHVLKDKLSTPYLE